MSNKTINDGGPAFPWEQSPGNQNNLGLSKREWFAGMALQGILSGAPDGIRYQDIPGVTYLAWAECAFRCADAMFVEQNIEAARHLDAADGK